MESLRDKTFYFESTKPITNKELYDVFTNKIKPEELEKERIGEYTTTKVDEDGKRTSFYGIIYSDGSVIFKFHESESKPAILINGTRTRNINRVTSKLSKLLRLDDLGGLVQVQAK